MSVHVFKVNETEWFAAENAEQAREEYRRMIGHRAADEEFADFGEAVQMSEEDLDRLEIVEVDEPGQPKMTFREALNDVIARKSWPITIASTEH